MEDVGAFDIGADRSVGDGRVDQALQGERHHAGSLGEELRVPVEEDAQTVCHAALGGDIADEALHPFRQGEIRRMPARQIVGGGGKRFDLAPIDDLDEMLPRGEVPVQSADTDTGPPRDLLEGGVDSILGKDGGGDLQQLVPITARIGAQALDRGTGRGLFAFGRDFDSRQWNSQRGWGLEPPVASPYLGNGGASDYVPRTLPYRYRSTRLACFVFAILQGNSVS